MLKHQPILSLSSCVDLHSPKMYTSVFNHVCTFIHPVTTIGYWNQCYLAHNPLTVLDTHTHIQLTPWNRVLLEKLIQPMKKFPAFYGIQKFITVFTRAHHWPLSWASWIKSTYHTFFSKINFNTDLLSMPIYEYVLYIHKNT